ncbi:MAG TPA: NAD(P)/FAD-dependent oxidoreductase [Bacteroidales bacterium]|nr:NAD(P)/FAD-dependent oxidoreductase [Bacteroidales bacterium]
MINIPDENKKRVVVAGCGFAGLTLARRLKKSGMQVVVVDKHNYHQFPPLFYQVASAGLEASSILFPIRKIFQDYRDFHIRKAEVVKVEADGNRLITTSGEISYDYLVLAMGATNSYFGSREMEENSNGMKTIAEVLDLRNSLLMNFENAVTAVSDEEKEKLLNIVIIGGGPSGVEIAGALSEMNRYVIPKDYPELKETPARIHLVEASPRLLGVMSEKSSAEAKKFLERTGVRVRLDTKVTGCANDTVHLSDGTSIPASMIIWTAGIKGNHVDGLPGDVITRNGRIRTDRYNRVEGCRNIFALGDIAMMAEDKYPNGHPQVAQVAIQQAVLLAANLKRETNGKPLKEFTYRDLGTMATVGRNLAVVELPWVQFHGIFAWFVWMFVHLMSIVGVRNRLVIFMNWAWKYLTYDQSTRLILRPKGCN